MSDSCIWCGNPNNVRQTANGAICSHCTEKWDRERNCPWCCNELCYNLNDLCESHYKALMEVHGQDEAFRMATA